MAKLFRDFYDRDTRTVARELVGKYLVRQWDGQLLVCRITETEAYIGRCDKACHAYQYRRTQRTETLFAAPGTAYIYLIYGMHHCLNLVTEAEGEPAAVLLRGGHACWNQEVISHLRFGKGTGELSAYQRKNFLNGPGKLCQAFAIDRSLYGADLTQPPLYLCDGPSCKVARATRVGIDYAGAWAAPRPACWTTSARCCWATEDLNGFLNRVRQVSV